MRVAIYVRVSTKQQSCDLQIEELKKYAADHSFVIHKIYLDTVTGDVLKRKIRTEYDTLMEDAERKLFDCVLVWKFDRFARSFVHLVSALEKFKSLKIEFISKTENIDTTTPSGRFFFNIMASVAEFERSIMRERITAGIASAKARGVKFGKKKTSRNGKLLLTESQKDLIRKYYQKGMHYTDIAKIMKERPDFIYKILRNSICQVRCVHGRYVTCRACGRPSRIQDRARSTAI
jgi:DNA invertase Pin-like site-specific DNA recombinase